MKSKIDISNYQKSYREGHKEKAKEYNKNYNISHREDIKANKMEYRSKNIESIKVSKHLHYSKNVKEISEKRKLCRRQAKMDCLSHYGKVCACCGESRPEFLVIDHINGGGNQHRKENGISGSSMYFWLRKRNFPIGFRVLCDNCNMSLGMYGYCPHDKEKESMEEYTI
jgi:hypothetical protein